MTQPQPLATVPAVPAQIDEIVAWHSHIYFDEHTRHIAERLNEELQDRFKIWDYRWLDQTNGLHPTPMFRFAILKEDFERYVYWILEARQGLSVLLHAITENVYIDHSYLTLWFGQQLTLGLDSMREQEGRRLAGVPTPVNDVLLVGQQRHLAGTVRYRPGDDTYKTRDFPPRRQA